jgi:murein DD-endopeptidase MepM/ murein hydrolase activator NlpD
VKNRLKITIIPHNTEKVREIKINKFLLILFLVFLVVPFIDKCWRGEPIRASKLGENNEYLRKKLNHYQQKYRGLSANYNTLLSRIKKCQSVVLVAPAVSSDKNLISIEELLAELEESSEVLEKVSLKLKETPGLTSHTPSISPCEGYIIQTYGKTNCIFTGEQRFCKGIDFAAPEGSEVYATADGRVKFAGFRRHAGLVVEIDHGYGFLTKYSHLSILKVRRGQVVNRGEIIGFVGTTGKTSGPRLHYEVWKDEKAMNPLDFILTEVKYF